MAKRKSEKLYEWSTNMVDGILTKQWADGTVHTLDVSKLPDISKDYLMFYGARQRGADIHAAKDLTVKQRQTITQEWIDNLEKGIVTLRTGSIPAEVYAEAVIACGLSRTEDLDEATAKLQELMDTAAERDADDNQTLNAKEANKALRKIKFHPKVEQWLIDNGHKQPKVEKALMDEPLI